MRRFSCYSCARWLTWSNGNYLIDIRLLEVSVCNCPEWSGQLISAGYFPTVPNAHTAIALEVLELFHALSTHGSFSKQGFARALESFHRTIRWRNSCSYTELFRNCVQFWLRVRLARDDYIHNILNGYFREKEAEPGRELNGRAPIVLGTGNMQSQCPACCYRTSATDASPMTFAIDGNLQHSRNAHVAPRSEPYLDSRLFFNLPVESRIDQEPSMQTKLEADDICKHNFKACAKPRTMKFYDETGLLLVVCRYLVPKFGISSSANIFMGG